MPLLCFFQLNLQHIFSMTLNIGDLRLESLGFFAVLFLQTTFTYAVSGFWPLKKHSWYRDWSAVISAIPLGHSLISTQPDLLKVTAAVLGTLLGLVTATWIAGKSSRTAKLVWSLDTLVLVSMIACLSNMRGGTSFFSGVLVALLANTALKACRKSKDSAPEEAPRDDRFAVPIRRMASRHARPRHIMLGDGEAKLDGNARSELGISPWPQVPQSRLNWHPRNN